MIITYDGDTMSACMYGGHIIEVETPEGLVVIAGIGDGVYSLAEQIGTLTPQGAVNAGVVDLLLLCQGKLATIGVVDGELGWVNPSAPYAIATNPLWAEVAMEAMKTMTAHEACSHVITEIAKAGAFTNTQTMVTE